MTLELWILLGYLVATGVADLRAGKLGFQVGGAPLFFTDITLLLLLTVSFVRRPSRMLYWLSEGVGAGTNGRAVWILCGLAAVYFALAFDQYRLYAARDLAIFWYSAFFPLTYFAIRSREDAATLLRYFTYAGVAAAVLLLLQETIGLDLGLFVRENRVALGQRLVALRSGDANVFCVLSLASLSGYVLAEPRRRYFNVACALACFFAVAAAMVRSGVVALLLSSGISLYCMRAKHRVHYLLFVALFALPVAMAPMMPPGLPGVGLLRGLRISVVSAGKGPSVDANAHFRLVRWKYASELWLAHPLLGVGFGRAIVPAGVPDKGERQGQFNVGMPHNSFLFFGARAGIIGLALIIYPWFAILWRLLATLRRAQNGDVLAAANILAAMLGCAMLGLFFERPSTNACFWIVMAAAARLVEYEPVKSMSAQTELCRVSLLPQPQGTPWSGRIDALSAGR